MIFTYTTVLGSAIAWLIATYLGLSNCWWAAMTVFLVAQPSRNLLIEKTVGRICGTIIGILLGAELFWQLKGHLGLMLLALTVWVALCTYFGARLKTSLRYGFTVAGFTAAVVLVPMILSPAAAYQTAFDRIAANIIGIVVALAFVLFLSLQTASDGKFKTPPPVFVPPWIAALRAFVVMTVASFIWLETAWVGAPLVVLASSVFVSFLSNHAGADRLARQILIGSIIGSAVGLTYRFWILPHFTSPFLILLAVWPAVSVGAYLSRYERTSRLSLDMIMIFFLMAQPGQLLKPSMASVHGACGVVIGTLVCLGIFMLIPRIFSKRLRPFAELSTHQDPQHPLSDKT